ncbi:putative cystathionine gamma-lyase [Gemmatimonadetes bacterium T265]|nr:putative cystathionine gamma-lyase [Gemmatimonadetes bacterium T265]
MPAPAQGMPFLPGPTFAAVYHAAGDPADTAYTYGRYHNPTWTQFEAALGDLEGGPAVTFASGMAAAAAVLGVVLRPGDVLVLPSDGYYTIRALVREHLAPAGVTVREIPTVSAVAGSVRGARLVWIESPVNPTLDVCDVSTIAAAARAAGALVAVDNTTATPLGQVPLALGADFSVASDTKALTGHGDLLLGHVAVRDAAWADTLRQWRTRTGAVPGPMEVWLAHRSLATLDVRLQRSCANAQTIAEFLRSHPAVQAVRYPGLADDPAHAIAARQMQCFGPVVSFTLADRAAAERFLAACRVVREATSFGGTHTTAERRARWGGDAVPPGFIRVSAGLEDAADLVEDLQQALAAA